MPEYQLVCKRCGEIVNIEDINLNGARDLQFVFDHPCKEIDEKITKSIYNRGYNAGFLDVRGNGE